MNFTRFVQTRVASEGGVTLAQLLGRQRARVFVLPRQYAMALLAAEGRLSTPQIGQAFGGRDHTTVIHARNAIARRHPGRDLVGEVEALRLEYNALTGGEGKVPSREDLLSDLADIDDVREQLRLVEAERDVAYRLCAETARDRDTWKRRAEAQAHDRSVIRAERAYGTVSLRNENEDLRAENAWLKDMLRERGVSSSVLKGLTAESSRDVYSARMAAS